MMSQIMLSVHMGMWNLIYRRESRGEGLGPEINAQSCLVGVQFLLMVYTHQFLTAFITAHLILVVTGHNSSHLPTPGRHFPSFFPCYEPEEALYWWLGLSHSQPAGGSGHRGIPGKQRGKLQHRLKVKRICSAFPCSCWAFHSGPSVLSLVRKEQEIDSYGENYIYIYIYKCK